ncbi:MAG TPA: HD domain-containing protein [Stellaceae bacterium]|nr:HD domain-containing protein [Stellaceae bacterium]
MADTMSLDERADALERKMSDELDVIYTKSALANMEDGYLGASGMGMDNLSKHPGKLFLIGDDPRLPTMPAKPTLLDYFKFRARGTNHLLQSATHALKAGMNEKTILACLLHDLANAMFIKSDHGYWGAQLIEPYVDEEVSWAIRAHQALRFFPDESVGYQYPVLYTNYFGPDYVPDDYIKEAYRRARAHRWYMTARMITVHDIYSFDPNAQVSLEPFLDIVGRHFRQPEEGLGYDNTPVAHMWRTIRRPTKYL